MRVAAIYDIHGNLPALEAVLEEIRREGVAEVVVGGDIVPGPMLRETMARLLGLDVPVRFICGNCEVAVLEEMAGKAPARVPGAYRSRFRWAAEARLQASACRLAEDCAHGNSEVGRGAVLPRGPRGMRMRSSRA